MDAVDYRLYRTLVQLDVRPGITSDELIRDADLVDGWESGKEALTVCVWRGWARLELTKQGEATYCLTDTGAGMLELIIAGKVHVARPETVQ